MMADGEPPLHIEKQDFYGDTSGSYSFQATVGEDKLKEFGLMDLLKDFD
ncbi:MAG: hypothetical protein QGG67_11390 [Gammaproteobacteria bacterium]|jgi:RAB protein geranylgeranyltransferase component A|nr:hypothetical protein [Gammaproteobacteria bacterium]HJO12623.1 hypothetical protein [Gammaproteobacteria bacterium]|tara:strand:+ start:80 stop:226 length:147 start_codon:yes stop_codon:yes gene_type:complete